MKNLIANILRGRSVRFDLLCGILVMLIVVLGCGDSGSSSTNSNSEKETKKEILSAYIGTWTGQDGSTLTIRNDSSGDYKSGGTSVSGASVEVDEAAKEIRFTMLGFDSGKYKIDQPPAGNKMKLDGMEYRRAEGFAADDSSDKKTVSKDGADVPSENEIKPIATKTIKDFDAALQQGDFSEFYSNVSETWQNQIIAADLDKAFAPLAGQKNDYKLKANTPITFSSKFALKDNVLEVSGGYQNIKGKTIPFRLRYIKEDSDWKLLGIRLNP